MIDRRGTLQSIGDVGLTSVRAMVRELHRKVKEEGYVLSDEPPLPDCEVCGDIGWVGMGVNLGEPGFGRAVRCSKCAPPPKRIAPLDMTFEAFNLYGDHPNDYKLTDALETAKAFAAGDWPTWVTFLGSNGSGKDHLAYAMLQARQDRGEQVVATRSNQMLRLIFETMRDESAETEQNRVDHYARAQVLLVSELEKASQTDASRARTSEIFDERYANQLPTIITSNWKLPAIGRVWPDVASRMSDGSLGAIVDLEGVLDHRKRG